MQKSELVPLGDDLKRDLSKLAKVSIEQIINHLGKSSTIKKAEEKEMMVTLKAFNGCSNMISAINHHEQNRILLAFRTGKTDQKVGENLNKLLPGFIK